MVEEIEDTPDQIDQSTQQDPPSKASKLYKSLINDGYNEKNLGNEQEFTQALSDPAKADKIFSGLINDGYTEKNLGSKQEFLSTFTAKQNSKPSALSQLGTFETHPTVNNLTGAEKQELAGTGALVAPKNDQEKIIKKTIEERKNPAIQYGRSVKTVESDLSKNPLIPANYAAAVSGNGEPVLPNGKLPIADYVNNRSEQIDQKITELQNKISQANIFNNSRAAQLSGKKTDIKPIQDQLDQLKQYKSELQQSSTVMATKQAINAVPYPSINTTENLSRYYQEVGRKVDQTRDDINVTREENNQKTGNNSKRDGEIVASENLSREANGLEYAKHSADIDFHLGAITPEQYNLKIAEINDQKQKLLDNHPAAKKSVYAQAVGQIIARRRDEFNKAANTMNNAGDFKSLYENIVNWGANSSEVKDAFDELEKNGAKIDPTIKEYLIKHPDETAGTSTIGNFYNTLITKTDQDLKDIFGRDENVSESERFQRNKKFVNLPHQELKQPGSVISTDGPDILQPVENPNAGKYNGYGIANTMGNTAGVVLKYALLTKRLGAAADAAIGGVAGAETVGYTNELGKIKEITQLTAEQKNFIGTLGATVLISHHDNLEAAKQFTNNPEEQKAYAGIMDVVNTLVFTKINPAGMIDKITGANAGVEKTFFDMAAKDGIQALNKETAATFIKDAIVNTGKNLGHTIPLLEANDLAAVGVQALFNPQSVKDIDLGQRMKEVAIESAIAFAPISLLTGFGEAKTARGQRESIRASAYELAKDPEGFQKFINEQVEAGKLDKAEGAKKVSFINKLNETVNSKDLKTEKVKSLSPDQKAEYAVNLTNEQMLLDGMKDMIDNVQLTEVKDQVKVLQEERQALLNPPVDKVEPTETTPEKIAFAEKELSSEHADMIVEEGLTIETLEANEHLFNGFPYTKDDFRVIKQYLNEQGASTTKPADTEQKSVSDVGDRQDVVPSKESGEGGLTEKGGQPDPTTPEVTPKKVKTNEQKAVEELVEKQTEELRIARESLSEKRKELDKEIVADQPDLFGERKIEQGNTLFNERVDPKEREKILQPFKDRVTKSEKELERLNNQLSDLQDKPTSQIDAFDQKVDDIATKVIDFLSPEHLRDVNKQGIGVKEVIEGAAEIIKKAHKAGKAISDIVDEAIKYVKDNWENHWGPLDENKLRTIFEDGLKKKIEKNEENKALTKEEIAQTLKDNAKNKSFIKSIADSGIVTGIKKIFAGTIRAFHPFLLDKTGQARDAAMVIRVNKGQEAHDNTAADEASDHALSFWNKQKRVDNVAFMVSMENPDKYGTVDNELKRLAVAYKNRMNTVFDMISGIKDVNFIEDYFPHFWKNPEKAKSTLPNLGKTPLEGNKSFLKKRFYENIIDGLKAGLDLATYNPEEMVRMAEKNALHFKTAHDIFDQLKNNGLIKYYGTGKEIPEGFVKIEDPLFNKKISFIDKDGNPASMEGAYYAADAVAGVVNNFSKKGLFNSGGAVGTITKTVRYYNNVKNMIQLGMGLFHFTTTSIDATVTGWGNAFKLISTGRLPLMAKGAFDLAKSITILPNLAQTAYRGFKANKAYLHNEASAEVDDMIQAGARVKMQKIYAIDAAYNAKKAWLNFTADHKPVDLAKAAWNGAWVLPEKLIGHLLMEKWVPALKTGGYLRTLHNEILANPDMSDRDLLKAKQRIWDAMDNRLGQVVYDNVFWDKAIKDLGFMGIRSLGWTGGTIKAFGTGAADLVKSAKNLPQGKGIENTTAWMLALPVSVGAYGALYQYMMTGQSPQELKDYFFPKDGTKNPDGTDHRVSLPTYMKDFYAYSKDPLTTMGHKTSPFVNDMIDTYKNADFYNTRIWNPDDPFYQKGIDYMNYQASTMVPFSFKQRPGEQQGFFENIATRQGVERVFGVMPASKEFERNDLENKISEEARKNYSDEVRTKEEADKFGARYEIKKALRTGIAYSDIPQELRDKAKYEGTSLKNVIRDSQQDYYGITFKHLHSDQQLKIWMDMKEEDRKKFAMFLHKPDAFEKLQHEKPEFFENKPELKKAIEEMNKYRAGDKNDKEEITHL